MTPQSFSKNSDLLDKGLRLENETLKSVIYAMLKAEGGSIVVHKSDIEQPFREGCMQKVEGVRGMIQFKLVVEPRQNG